jgi:predicted phage tail protein
MLTVRPFNQIALSKIIKLFTAKAPLAVLALALLISLSCGKRSAPLPPRERVIQRVELNGFQRGNQVVLSWKMPARNAGTNSVLNIDRIDVYRLAEPQNSSLTLSEEDFSSRSALVATIPVKDTDFSLKAMTYSDTLQFAGQPARLRYGIRFVNASGQKAAFSNFLLVEPAARIAAAPTSLTAEVSQDAIILKWQEPASNVDLSTPTNLIGYNLYRSPNDKQPAKLLNETPVKTAEYRDEFFEFGKQYFYFVRAVSSGTGGEPVESRESNIVNLTPKDIFAPSAPAAITLAATPTSISLFFAANPEKDIAGYRIYRSNDPDLDKAKWGLLTPELLPTNTYQDVKVEAGKKYYYYLTAVDKTGNVSEASEVVSEIVP